MCGGVHYGEVEGLVSVERWSCVLSVWSRRAKARSIQ